jgi:hypothetical protein
MPKRKKPKSINYIFKWICFVIIGSCVSCAATHPSKKVGPFVPEKHRAYFNNVYGNAPKDMAIHGAYAIRMGIYHKEALRSANQLIASNILQSFVDAISIMRPPVSDVITVYIDVWGVSKKDHRRKEEEYIDFATALSIHSKEYARIGVYEELDILKNTLAKKITMFTKERYKNTYEMFVIGCKLIAMAKAPSGSLKSYRVRRQELLSELDRVTPLAELEFI